MADVTMIPKSCANPDEISRIVVIFQFLLDFIIQLYRNRTENQRIDVAKHTFPQTPPYINDLSGDIVLEIYIQRIAGEYNGFKRLLVDREPQSLVNVLGII